MILAAIILYILLLLVLSRITSARTSNDAFFAGEHKSPWYVVAFGMIGASISGVTFVSVPGMVLTQDMTYLQMCLGFIIGYYIVAYVLLPVYYRHNLTSIYTYLGRMGRRSYVTGASFFILSKLTGAAVRFYLVCMLLQRFFLDSYGIPFWLTVIVLVLLIWVYTKQSGIRTIVWTDALQTLCMFAALVMIISAVVGHMDMSLSQAVTAISQSEHSRIFVFDDWGSTQNFWKQFLSGIFVVIVMTGLDQDMMQKNLTCRSLKEAQKDVCTYGFAFVPANLLFLALGVLLVIYAGQQGVALPAKGDELLPMFAATGVLGQGVAAIFIVGLVASSFSSADSALTALTTSTCVDIFNRPQDTRLRKRVHIAVVLIFINSIIIFDTIGSSSVINLIYTLCGYTYGPLLGLFAYALTCRRQVRDSIVPYICIAAPLMCYAIDMAMQQTTGYRFGYELLMLNGLLTFAGCWLTSRKAETA